MTLYIIHTTKYVLHMNSKHDVCTGKTDFISLFRYMYIHSVTRSAKANMFTLSPSRKTARQTIKFIRLKYDLINVFH